jgi:hypothetical protein
MKTIYKSPILQMLRFKVKEIRLAQEYQIEKWPQMDREERMEIVGYIRLLRVEIRDLLGKINFYK